MPAHVPRACGCPGSISAVNGQAASRLLRWSAGLVEVIHTHGSVATLAAQVVQLEGLSGERLDSFLKA